MTATDIGLFLGQLVTAWALGFSAGFTLTKFRDAMNSTL